MHYNDLDPARELNEAVDAIVDIAERYDDLVTCSRCGHRGCPQAPHEASVYEREEIQKATREIVEALRQDSDNPLPIDLKTWRLLLTVPRFGAEPSYADFETLSAIAAHCQCREHAESVAWLMAEHRADREYLAVAAGHRWALGA